MKILAIGGCGAMGKAATRALIEMPVFDEIIIGDINLEAAQAWAQKLGDRHVRALRVDVKDAASLRAATRGADIVANLTLYEFNLPVMQACLENRCHYLDLGGLYHVTKKQLALHEKFKAIDRLALLGIGASPGMTNIAAAMGAKQLDQVTDIHIRTGTKGGGKGFGYSAKTVLDECTMNAFVFENGKMQEMPPLSGRERYTLPDPVGEVEGFYSIHSELATLPYQYPGIQSVSFRVAFSPRLVNMVETLIDLKLTSLEKFPYRGIEIAPREFLDAHLMRLPKPEELSEFKAFRVEVGGIKDEERKAKNVKRKTVVYEILVPSKQDWGIKAGAYWTGVPAAVAAELMAEGKYVTAGTLAPEAAFEPEIMPARLADYDLRIKAVAQ
jgi:saccharopine dehydrogenase (NAD+, L-lysine-forming)